MTVESKEEFFTSGSHHVDHVLGVLRSRFVPNFVPKRVLDFGCGVGRLLVPFAAKAESVVGLDVSPSMLAEALRNCQTRGIENVSLALSDDSLSAAIESFDLVHSCIVLQHIEVPRGRELFSRLVSKICVGGFGVLHVTFAWNAYESTFGQPPALPPPPPERRLSATRRWIRRLWRNSEVDAQVRQAEEPTDPEMQMNYYNLSELTFVLQRAGVRWFHTELTDHGGALGAVLYFQIHDLGPGALP